MCYAKKKELNGGGRAEETVLGSLKMDLPKPRVCSFYLEQGRRPFHSHIQNYVPFFGRRIRMGQQGRQLGCLRMTHRRGTRQTGLRIFGTYAITRFLHGLIASVRRHVIADPKATGKAVGVAVPNGWTARRATAKVLVTGGFVFLPHFL